jgi:hypothetical protein
MAESMRRRILSFIFERINKRRQFSELIRFSEFYYQSSVDGLANGSDAFGG